MDTKSPLPEKRLPSCWLMRGRLPCSSRQRSSLAITPGSARATKHQIYRDLHRGAAESVTDAERLMESMIRHPDYGEGVKAWMEKRGANWRG